MPDSNPAKASTLRSTGKANRWGVFLPDPQKSLVLFENPGEYRCDVTVKYVDQNGVWWMASRREASVVVTPNSDVVIHGERGNRAPSMKWRARWFVARNSHFITGTPPEFNNGQFPVIIHEGYLPLHLVPPRLRALVPVFWHIPHSI